jgi:thiamine biosynthesis lipoprotein
MGEKLYGIKRILLMLVLGSLLLGCAKNGEKATEKTDAVMGTILIQNIYGSNGAAAAQRVRDRLLELEQESLSRRIPDAEIALINQASKDALEQNDPTKSQMITVELTDTLWNWMEHTMAMSRVSDGALDVTLGTLTALWDIDAWASAQEWQQYPLPTRNQINTALQRSGYDKTLLENHFLTMPVGTQLDLGAVGKGIACDEAAKILLADDKITGAIISVGGSILTYGTKPDKTPWVVGIVNPRDTDHYLGRLTLRGQWCVATSGDYERYVEVDGVRYHHILDPSTGYPANRDVMSVTILSKSGLVSDALSTACFVLGIQQGLELARNCGVEALLVDTAGNIYMTDQMQDYFTRSME